MTGAGTTASVLGAPDLGIVSLHDFVQNGAMIARVAGETPVICGILLNSLPSLLLFPSPILTLAIETEDRCGYRVWRTY
jgi:hypothetical protein